MASVLNITVLALIAALPYLQIYYHPFLIIEDPAYITANPMVRAGFIPETVQWGFTSLFYGHWSPLTWASHTLDWALFGDWPGGHHLVSLGLHIITTLLLYRALLHLFKRGAGASFVVAALFATHPLQSEAVAWAACRKDILSGVCWMLALNAYLSYTETNKVSRLWLTTGALLVGLMAKSHLVVLPAIFMLLDYWPLKRFETLRCRAFISCMREKVLIFTISVMFIWVAARAQTDLGGLNLIEGGVGRAALNFWSYVQRIILPSDLGFPYAAPPYNQIVGVMAILTLLVSLIVAWHLRNIHPAVFLGWMWYCIIIAPYLQVLPVGLQMQADRWCYIPLVGVLILVVHVVADSRHLRPSVKQVLGVGACVISISLSLPQVSHWRNEEALLTHALSRGPNALAHVYRATMFKAQKDIAGAFLEFKAALGDDPYEILAFEPLAELLNASNRSTELESFLPTQAPHSVRENVSRARMLYVLSASTAQNERASMYLKQSEDLYATLVLERPDLIPPHIGLALIQASRGDFANALGRLHEALNRFPFSSSIHAVLAGLYREQGDINQAAHHYERSIWLNPMYSMNYVYLTQLLKQLGRANPYERILSRQGVHA